MERKMLVLLVGLTLTGIERGNAQDSLNVRLLGECRVPGEWNNLYVSGNYAYVGTYQGVYIIDVSDPRNPRKVSLYPSDTVHNVWVEDSYAYVGGSSGLYILDVSDPKNPKEVGVYKMGTKRVRVEGNYAYCCSSKEDLWYKGDLYILDVSDPSHPVQVGFYEIGRTFSLDVSSNYCYIVTHHMEGPFFIIIDVSNPQSPKQVVSCSLENASSPNDIQVVGKYAYISIEWQYKWTKSAGCLRIFDVSDPLSPKEVGKISGGWSSDGFAGAYIEYPFAYVDRVGHCFDIFDVSDGKWVGFYLGGYTASDIYAQNKYVYIVPGNYGLAIFEFYGPGIQEERNFREEQGVSLESILIKKKFLLIRYTLPTPSFYSLKLYDSAGKLLRVLDEGIRGAGNYTFQFSTNNLAPGLYFLSLTTREGSATKKVIILR